MQSIHMLWVSSGPPFLLLRSFPLYWVPHCRLSQAEEHLCFQFLAVVKISCPEYVQCCLECWWSLGRSAPSDPTGLWVTLCAFEPQFPHHSTEIVTFALDCLG